MKMLKADRKEPLGKESQGVPEEKEAVGGIGALGMAVGICLEGTPR